MDPIRYASPDTPQSSRRWPARWLAVAIGLLMVVIFVPLNLQTQTESWVDTVTGSMTWKTTGPFGIGSGTRFDVSALETRLNKSGIQWTPSWQFIHNTHENVFGRTTTYECGRAPTIYSLRPVLTDFAAASTDDELREFVRIMQTGTDAEQQAAVEAAGEKALQATSQSPVGEVME